MRTHRGLAALAALALAAAPLAAQENDAGDEPRNAISLQPIGVLYNVYSLDYERRVGDGLSLGVAGSWYARGGPVPLWDEYGSTESRALALDAKLRYYLGDATFTGVALVAQLGSYGERTYQSYADAERLEWRHSPTVGIGFEYTSRSTGASFVTVGIGAKRALDDRDTWTLPTGALTLRLAVGGLF